MHAYIDSESELMDMAIIWGRRTHTEKIIYNYKESGKPLFKYLLNGINGSGGQKNGIFAPGCNVGWGGVEVRGQLVGVDVNVEVEELADWDVGDIGVPLPVVPGADEVPGTEPESKKNHLQTVFLTQTNLTSNSYFKKLVPRHCTYFLTYMPGSHRRLICIYLKIQTMKFYFERWSP
jgi:hypothetical protein